MARKLPKLTAQEQKIKDEISKSIKKADGGVFIVCRLRGLKDRVVVRADEAVGVLLEAIKRRDGIEGEIRIA